LNHEVTKGTKKTTQNAFWMDQRDSQVDASRREVILRIDFILSENV
jgi:hypothetical protein